MTERQPILHVKDLTKKFRFSMDRPNSLKSFLVSLMHGKFDFFQTQEYLCFQDVNFDIYPGEFVGIMGRNGEGKSTLFKILCGIYQPTSGVVQSHARIAPLIELGAGFHSELSGYENIFLNAAILGFGRKAVYDALQDILDFAELGDRIHVPVRTYSSGMLVRLGFSIVSHLVSPIILADEVFSVGDVYFQGKCINKIQSLYHQGCTILLITHNVELVSNYCSRVIVLGKQKKLYDGPVQEGVKIYRDFCAEGH